MPKLTIIEFGNPNLRQPVSLIKPSDITGSEIQNLITSMRQSLIEKKLGIGLAAPQVGMSISLAVVAIRPSKRRPTASSFDLVLINPKLIETFGRRTQMYEGCISGGPGRAGLFALVPRYKKLRVSYYDESGKQHNQSFDGLKAHVIQHEIDHLNGVLFVDRVINPKSYMTHKEYMAKVKVEASKKAKAKS